MSSLDFGRPKKVTPWNFVLASGVMEHATKPNGVDNKIIRRVKMYIYFCTLQLEHYCQSRSFSPMLEKMTQKLRCLPLSLPLIFFLVLMIYTGELRVCSLDQKFAREDFPDDFVFGSGTSAYQVISPFFLSSNRLNYS